IHGFGVYHPAGELQDIFSPVTVLHELICLLRVSRSPAAGIHESSTLTAPRSCCYPSGVLMPPASSTKSVDWPTAATDCLQASGLTPS
ncbi:mCG144746, partial [Mus musculus]